MIRMVVGIVLLYSAVCFGIPAIMPIVHGADADQALIDNFNSAMSQITNSPEPVFDSTHITADLLRVIPILERKLVSEIDAVIAQIAKTNNEIGSTVAQNQRVIPPRRTTVDIDPEPPQIRILMPDGSFQMQGVFNIQPPPYNSEAAEQLRRANLRLPIREVGARLASERVLLADLQRRLAAVRSARLTVERLLELLFNNAAYTKELVKRAQKAGWLITSQQARSLLENLANINSVPRNSSVLSFNQAASPPNPPITSTPPQPRPVIRIAPPDPFDTLLGGFLGSSRRLPPPDTDLGSRFYLTPPRTISTLEAINSNLPAIPIETTPFDPNTLKGYTVVPGKAGAPDLLIKSPITAQSITDKLALIKSTGSSITTNQFALARARSLAGRLGYVGLVFDFFYSVFMREPYSYQEVSYRVAEYKKILADEGDRAAASGGDHGLMEARNRASAELMYWEKIKDEMDEKYKKVMNSLSEKDRLYWEWIQRDGT